MSLLFRLYAILLHLYPQSFRDEFADEMLSVFVSATRQAQAQGVSALISTCLRELRDLPIAILYEHWRERKNKPMEPHHPSSFKPGSWREFLLATLPFGPIALMILLNALHLVLPEWVGIGLLAVLILLPIVFLVGLVKGLPRWCLPLSWPKTSFVFIIAAKTSHLEAWHLDLSKDEVFGQHTSGMCGPSAGAGAARCSGSRARIPATEPKLGI